MNSIRSKLTAVLLLMALVPLLTLGIIIYNQTTNIFTENIQESLFTIVKSKNAALENFLDSTNTLGRALGSTDAVQTYISLANRELNTEETIAFEAAAAEVDSLLYNVQTAHWGKYHHVFLIDSTQTIAISPNHGEAERGSPSSHLGEDTSGNEWAARALAEGVPTVSDFSSWVESDHTHQMMFVPVKDNANRTRAVLGFELQIPYEQEILTEDFELGETGSVFLTTLEGVPIVFQGIEEQAPLNTPGINEAIQNGSSFGRRSNAAGVDVIDVYLKNETLPWILVAEVEAQEAFRNLRSIQITMAIGFVVTLLLVVGLSIMIANFIVNPITHLTKQMEEVSLGKLDIKIDNAGRSDEIGQLVQAFNRIVKSLKIAMKGLKKNQRS